MTPEAQHLIVRAASLYLAVALTAVAWAWRRPTRRAAGGAVLAFVWNLPAVLALNVLAARVGLWQFGASGGLLLGVPVDLWLAWAWLWGAVPALAFPSLPVAVILLIALGLDLILMPAAAPVVRLGPWWLAGEVIALVACLLPAQLLARWTARSERLLLRALLQVAAFSGLVAFVLPAVAIEGSGGRWASPLALPVWQLSLYIQALALAALFGLTAVQEFVERGAGTPVPFDPPQRLVRTGVYRYVRNPMQLSGVLVLVVLGVILQNPWVAGAGVMAHLFSVGLAGWNENEELHRRFGDDWDVYRRGVRRWVPRLRPWHPAGAAGSRLYLSENCGMCREIARWFDRRNTTWLELVAAEAHPSDALERITYEPPDGTPAVVGIEALGRALEHTHLGWAAVGWFLRLPIVRPLAQLLTDASGGEPRRIARRRTRCSPGPPPRISC
jgi:protein-S-isoprenylcysteine O-methyltransferase Ste14